MIRVSRRNLRFYRSITLFAAVCSFFLGVSLSLYLHTQAPYPNNPVVIEQPSLKNDLTPSFGVEETEEQNLQPDISDYEPLPPVDKNTLQPQAFHPPTNFQGKTLKNVKVGEQNKVIALTFDDGPKPKYTEQILQILKKNNIKATFFWIGRFVEAYPEIALKVVAQGHAIGNHTWTHSYDNMSRSLASYEIEDTAAIIESVTKVKTTLFRPPGGLLTNGPTDYAISRDYAVLLWSADSKDFSRKVSVDSIISRVLKSAKPGGMVLMHDGGGDRTRTVQALPTIINSLREQGYKFVTVPELLAMDEGGGVEKQGSS